LISAHRHERGEFDEALAQKLREQLPEYLRGVVAPFVAALLLLSLPATFSSRLLQEKKWATFTPF